MKKHFLPILFLLGLSSLGLRALFQEGVFTAHDIWHQVGRLYWYRASLTEGVVPFWVQGLAHGFGYPLFVFSYHLPWITDIPLMLLGVNIIQSIKILFFSSFFASGVSMYLLLQVLFKKRIPSLLGASLYIWAPYRFVTILVSAAIGRAYVFAIAPLLLLGIYLLGNPKQRKWGIIIVGIAGTTLILSHLMSAISLVPIVLMFVFWARPPFRALLLSLLLTIGLSAFYLLPLLLYTPLTHATSLDFRYLYRDNLVTIWEIIYSKWGYGIASSAKIIGGTSYQLGIAQWVGAILLLGYSLSTKKKAIPMALLLTLVASIFLMTHGSRFVWDAVAPIFAVDYPTMFLIPSLLVISVGVALVTSNIKNRFVLYVTFVFLVLLAIIGNRNHLRVNMYLDRGVTDIVNSETTTNSFHEYLPKTFSRDLFGIPDIKLVAGGEEIGSSSVKASRLSFTFKAPREDNYIFKVASFPGVTLQIDGRDTVTTTSSEGLLVANVSEGSHIATVFYKPPAIVIIARLVTLITAICLLVVILIKIPKKGKSR